MFAKTTKPSWKLHEMLRVSALADLTRVEPILIGPPVTEDQAILAQFESEAKKAGDPKLEKAAKAAAEKATAAKHELARLSNEAEAFRERRTQLYREGNVAAAAQATREWRDATDHRDAQADYLKVLDAEAAELASQAEKAKDKAQWNARQAALSAAKAKREELLARLAEVGGGLLGEILGVDAAIRRLNAA